MNAEAKDQQAISSIDRLLEQARAGEMFILMDDREGETTGDLCILAEHCDDVVINTMLKHARGLICLAIDKERATTLGLNYSERIFDAPRHSAVTISIEARAGITSGVSARDRAHSIKIAADPDYGASDIVSPGHLFPLIAVEGGTLVRAGRTEAVVDLAKAAGNWPAGVICQIMNEEGSLADRAFLEAFAKTHQIGIGTIADLIAWKRRRQSIIKRSGEIMFNSSNGGNWRMLVYDNTASYAEHVALNKGDLSSPEPVLVRMHAINIMTDVLGEQLSGRTGNEIQLAMQMIANEGRGLIVMLREPSPTTISDLVQRKAAGDGTSRNEIRNYGVGAQILNDLGVNHMILLSNVKRSIVGLDGYGLTIAGYREFDEGNDDHV